MYVIYSEEKGVSTACYTKHETALAAARAAWKVDPQGVGMCHILDLEDDREEINYLLDGINWNDWEYARLETVNA